MTRAQSPTRQPSPRRTKSLIANDRGAVLVEYMAVWGAVIIGARDRGHRSGAGADERLERVQERYPLLASRRGAAEGPGVSLSDSARQAPREAEIARDTCVAPLLPSKGLCPGALRRERRIVFADNRDRSVAPRLLKASGGDRGKRLAEELIVAGVRAQVRPPDDARRDQEPMKSNPHLSLRLCGRCGGRLRLNLRSGRIPTGCRWARLWLRPWGISCGAP